ncbi:hypothetical protein [Dietzia sp. Die43]|uniref:hypothetical protein n=1 Tax=Dietzia sp. Die43 TaxID=2926011 RepID=UPI002118131E|nr:hypothetical protein [Dietzia sp. Die43]
MTEPTPHATELRARLGSALSATGSPLMLEPYRATWLPEDELAFSDSRFTGSHALIPGSRATLLASRLENLLATESISEVITRIENLSAAYEIADAVERETSGTSPHARAARAGFADKALAHAVVSLYSGDDAMTVDVPVGHVNLYNEDEIGASAMHALQDEVDRVTGTTFLERVELPQPVGKIIHEGTLSPSNAAERPSPFEAESSSSIEGERSSPFRLGNLFTRRSAENNRSVVDPVTSPGRDAAAESWFEL